MSKKRKAVRIIGIILLVITVFLLTVNIIPPRDNVENNPFIVEKGQLPMIAAHRGGGLCNPENTMLAFREAVKAYNVEIIESDLYLTKDGYLVYNHDDYIDETCNVNGDISLDEVKELCKDETNRHYIKDMTLEELRKYNFGYYFKDKSGERIYKGETDLASKGLQIATIDQLFEEFYQTNPELLFIVEIKDSGERGFEACRILYETLQKYPAYMDRIVIGTFHDEIETEMKSKYPNIMRGAPMGTAAKFIVTQMFKVNIFDNGDFACLQIPTDYDVGITLKLDKETYVRRAHRRNIAVQYWTINDEETMRELIELGCDCIMTDDPLLLKSVLDSYR
ncbi:MAG: hypothetical protein IJ445_07395 [Clostridia bacterium]|nr:hypothetical protein [Clostridia bacterium]